MITNSGLWIEGSGRDRQFRIQNTWDGREVVEHMNELRSMGGKTGRSDDGSMRLMGEIPVEMWSYDPWLLEAKKARNGGDLGQYTEMIKKFFEVHRELSMPFEKRIFTVR